MHYLALDTNTWIYLANGKEPVKFLKFIQVEITKGNITILLPEMVLSEWNKHKTETIMRDGIAPYKTVLTSLDRLMKLLGDKGKRNPLDFLYGVKDEGEYVEEIQNKFKTVEGKIESAIKGNIELIDYILNNLAKKIKFKESIFTTAGNRALQSKAPFHSKFSFADAMILFSYLEYVAEKSIKNSMFITYNVKDFCTKERGDWTLHPDLQEEFSKCKCQFFSSIGEAINVIDSSVTNKEELEFIDEMRKEHEKDYDPDFCEVCKENNGKWNAIYWRKPIEIFDERKEKRVAPNQTTLGFAKQLKSIPKNEMESGQCDWCGTEHFRCTDCNYINALWDGDYNEPKWCENCGLEYLVKRHHDGDEILENEYIIPKKTVTCQKCSNEFDKENMIENLCLSCEDEYSYGEK